MLNVGDKIPDMEFEVFQKNEIKKTKFSKYKNKWLVLLFYPADFTFICPTELEEAADLYKEFKKEGAEIISISKDTAFVHKAWHDNSAAISKVTYPMAADPTGALCTAFGTLISNEGLSMRGTFIVDPDGIIKSIEKHDNSIGRNAKEILRKLRAAKFVREHNGMVCPASWEPGKDILKPGVDLIGKI